MGVATVPEGVCVDESTVVVMVVFMVVVVLIVVELSAC